MTKDTKPKAKTGRRLSDALRKQNATAPAKTLADWRKRMEQQLEGKQQTGEDMTAVFMGFRRWGNLKMTEPMKEAFCEALAKTGRITAACKAVGVVPSTIADHRKADPEFDLACQTALRAYADWVVERVQDIAFNGVVTERKKLYSEDGDDEGEIIKKQFLPAIIAMEAKRVEPAYRDKQEVQVTQTTSHVLVVPEQAADPDEWESHVQQHALPKPDEEK